MRRTNISLLALTAILGISVSWWALALWPLTTTAPEWLVRTRLACFGDAHNGLPDAGGWVMLIGQPVGMLVALFAVWGDSVAGGLRLLWRSGRGRLTMGAVSAGLLLGVGASAWRVAGVLSAGDPAVNVGSARAVRLDTPAPALALTDQRGAAISLSSLRGRPVWLAFAYGHCQTVCPLVVHDLVAARARLPDAAPRPVLLVVTLDPWRDTPDRLPSIAASWNLPDDAHLLGGDVDTVEAVLDAWRVPRARDVSTGEITHTGSVYLIDRNGRLAWVIPGQAGGIAALASGLQPGARRESPETRPDSL